MKRSLTLGFCMVFALVGTLPAGIRYTAETSTQSPGQRRPERAVIKGLADGKNARIEFIEGANPMAQPGTYLVSRDAGQTVYLVNPEEKSYMELDLDKLAGAAGDMMNALGGMVNIEVKDHTVETLQDQAGPAIHGYPTRHVKVRSAFTIETRVMGMRQTQQHAREDEIWSTDKLDEEGLMLWVRQGGFKTGHKSIDSLLAEELKQVKGFPLKRITTARETQRGRSQETVTRFEVTEIATVSAAASDFEVPAGYELVTIEMPDLRQLQEAAGEPEPAGGTSSEEAGAVDSLMRMLRPRR